ncbi:MAG TPA: hypothetical protein VKZ79_01315 [Alphaproteobacteria bacterium]|nr:hypothetical protein [Alphaproteobacteria bacterium]
MSIKFETLGNATIQLFDESGPVLATDPWLVGTCYFGSWALDHALTPEQIANVVNSKFIWISHGHPDHLHHQSLDLLPRGKKILLPDHYDSEIHNFLIERGFDVTVLPYRKWFRVSPQIEVMCLDNINQDAILVVRLGDALLINLNDSPIAGELSFLRKLVRRHPNDKTYLAALCSIDADMINFVDNEDRRTIEPPEERKPGAIWNVARIAASLGVRNFCCSSSQHIYVRSDSIWANAYRITWPDIQQHWSRPAVRPIEPFVTVDATTGAITRNYPLQAPDASQITDRTGEDDWNEKMSEEDWSAVDAFFRRFDMIRPHFDFLEVSIGGDRRRFELKPAHRKPLSKQHGVVFIAPKRSFMEAIKWGYFDDLLIGNFMKVRLINTGLYPRFTPLVAKLGGNAKVYSRPQYRKFLRRYFVRNPFGTLAYLLEPEKNYVFMPWLRRRAEAIGIKAPLKYVYRSMRGDPIGRAASVGPGLREPAPSQIVTLPADEKPIIITVIDTEENFDWDAPYSSSSVSVHGMREIETLQRLFDRHRVKPIYMVDYAIANQRDGYGPLLDAVKDKRCEIGAHLHPWVNPPIIEEICARNSYPFNLPKSLEREKLRTLTSMISASFGVKPEVYKAGRYGIGAATPDLLTEQGYKVDLSVVPTRDYTDQFGPDFSGFDAAPFWIDEKHRLLEIPFTTSFIGAMRGQGNSFFRVMNSQTGRAFHLPGAFARLGLMNRVNLTPEGVTLKEGKALTRQLAANGVRVFTLAFHSTSLTPGSTPYVGSIAQRDAFYRWLDSYFEFFFGEMGGRAMTPMEFYNLILGLEGKDRRMEMLATAE